MLALDIDPRHGGDTNLDDLVAEYGPLPHTDEEITKQEASELFDDLAEQRRATVVRSGDVSLRVAAERLPELLAVLPGATVRPELTVPERYARKEWSAEDAEIRKGMRMKYFHTESV